MVTQPDPRSPVLQLPRTHRASTHSSCLVQAAPSPPSEQRPAMQMPLSQSVRSEHGAPTSPLLQYPSTQWPLAQPASLTQKSPSPSPTNSHRSASGEQTAGVPLGAGAQPILKALGKSGFDPKTRPLY